MSLTLKRTSSFSNKNTKSQTKKINARVPTKKIIELPLVSQIVCNLCNSKEFNFNFTVQSSRHENFQIVTCKACKLVQVNPQPNPTACKPYYNENYFLVRKKEGYNNYYSKELQNEITRVYIKNLKDLNFFEFETKLFSTFSHSKTTKSKTKNSPTALDVGCAAGYFVELLKNRGWKSEGIELVEGAALVARKRKLKVTVGDFLNNSSIENKTFNLISFWASLEHLHNPKAVFKQSSKLLVRGGRLLISTCNYALLAKVQKSNWRFMNVPQHLYFFNLEQLIKLGNDTGFELVTYITYGSGLTKKVGMGMGYKLLKIFLDSIVKKFNMGDMIALHFIKK